MKRQLAQRLILLSIGSFFSFLTVEFGLRLFTVRTFELIHPMFSRKNTFEFHPELGYTLRRNTSIDLKYIADNGLEKRTSIVTNSIGIRDTLPSSLDDKLLCAFVGDSFTEGYQVDGNMTYPALVKSTFSPRLNVVNFGIHWYDCSNYYKMALFIRKNYNLGYLFVGLFIGNDIAPYKERNYKRPPFPRSLDWHLQSLYSYSWLRLGLRSTIDSWNRANPLPSKDNGHPLNAATTSPPLTYPLLDTLKFLGDVFDDISNLECDKESLAQIMDQYIHYRTRSDFLCLYGDRDNLLRPVKATVRLLKELKDALGDCYLHVLIFPERVQVKDTEWRWLSEHFPGYKNRQLVIEMLTAEMENDQIPYTNCLPLLDEQCYLRFNAHFSEQGHKRVAEIVTTQLNSILNP